MGWHIRARNQPEILRGSAPRFQGTSFIHKRNDRVRALKLWGVLTVFTIDFVHDPHTECDLLLTLPMTMRRGVGLAAFERHKTDIQSYATLSDSLSRQSLDALQSQLGQFRAALQRFAASHREDIKKDPAFRASFQQMCSNIGVDPLAGPQKGGWWAELLGMGDWQYELGVQIVDICVGKRDQNGGMIEMDELVRLLNKLRGIPNASDSRAGYTSKELQELGAVTEEDVLRSIKTLKPLGAGYEVIDIGSRKMVRSVVKELDLDQATILEIAASVGGKVWADLIAGAANWPVERAVAALDNMLLRDGLCWMDDQDEDAPIVYWVMSVLQFE